VSHRKRRPSLDPSQLGFTFEPPEAASMPACLAGLDRFLAAGVGRALKEDTRSRAEIALAMSELLDDEVSKFMLDAYASEARENHNISADRFLALIAVTNRFDILDATVRRIGAALLVGDQIKTAEIGNIDRQIAALKQRRKRSRAALPWSRSRGREWKARGENNG
jgi:hypothetical protein